MSAASNFTFRNREKFFELPSGEDFKKGRGPKLPTIVLPVGSVIYRADHAGAKEPSTEVPAFFTNRGSTRAYRRNMSGTLSSYVVTKEARLFDMTIHSLSKLKKYLTTEKEHEVFDNYFVKVGKVPAVNPSYFTPDDLIEYQTKKVAYPNYLNRRMAEIICRIGFDGWVVKPITDDLETGLIQLSIARMMAGVNPLAEYTPEVMLCNWKEHMALKSLPEPNTPKGSPKGSPKGNGAGAAAAAASKERRTRKARR
jgi:hypothetical protein